MVAWTMVCLPRLVLGLVYVADGRSETALLGVVDPTEYGDVPVGHGV